jgi:anthranilate/para-aminobenzoate synthase component I
VIASASPELFFERTGDRLLLRTMKAPRRADITSPRARTAHQLRSSAEERAEKRATGEACYGAGGGITWSSGAAAEHDEVLTKAAVLDGRYRDFELDRRREPVRPRLRARRACRGRRCRQDAHGSDG